MNNEEIDEVKIRTEINELKYKRKDQQAKGGLSRQLIRQAFSSVQLLSHELFFATPWTAARPASLSIANSRSLL